MPISLSTQNRTIALCNTHGTLAPGVDNFPVILYILDDFKPAGGFTFWPDYYHGNGIVHLN